MITARELGKIFKDAREKMGISVLEANRRSKIHPEVIKEFENGTFGRLNKLYTKSFVKKYSDFLGLDAKEMLEKFESIAGNIAEAEFTFDVEDKETKAERKKIKKSVSPKKNTFEGKNIFTGKNVFTKKSIQIILAATLSVILIILFFVLFGIIRKRIAFSPRPSVSASSVSKQKKPAAVLTNTSMAKATTSLKTNTTADASSGEPVNLKLFATGEVWVKVMYGDKQLFVGTLQEGESQVFSARGTLTVWSGKAEKLILVVNTHRVGAVAAGVVKDIEVSAKGVKVKGNWVAQL